MTPTVRQLSLLLAFAALAAGCTAPMSADPMGERPYLVAVDALEQDVAALARTWGDRLHDALVAEHRDLERLLADVIDGGTGWAQLVGRLADELTEHIFDEETDLFPYSLYELTPEQWDEVETVHATARGRAPVGL